MGVAFGCHGRGVAGCVLHLSGFAAINPAGAGPGQNHGSDPAAAYNTKRSRAWPRNRIVQADCFCNTKHFRDEPGSPAGPRTKRACILTGARHLELSCDLAGGTRRDAISATSG